MSKDNVRRDGLDLGLGLLSLAIGIGAGAARAEALRREPSRTKRYVVEETSDFFGTRRRVTEVGSSLSDEIDSLIRDTADRTRDDAELDAIKAIAKENPILGYSLMSKRLERRR